MKTSELIGPALDWAVAKAEGKADDCQVYPSKTVWYGRWTSGFVQYRPSEKWDQGGPIIDREGISTVLLYGTTWGATTYDVRDIVLDRNEAHYQGIGPTRLIAAMRCYVSIKLGDEVEIPQELT